MAKLDIRWQQRFTHYQKALRQLERSVKLGRQRLLKIAAELDDLLLPYKVDLSIMRHIEDKAVIEHIKRVGVVFYEKVSYAQSRTRNEKALDSR